jgi:carbon monoxide dehydrogenase subunit G
MHLEDAYRLKASRLRAWDFISNPEQIAKCLPDLESFQMKDSKSFTVTVKVGVAFLRGSFKFDFTLLDQIPPSHSSFEAHGKGAGVSVRLNATIDLTETDMNSTELAWKADAQLGGLLGEMSPSLLQDSTGNFVQRFFDCLKTKLESES